MPAPETDWYVLTMIRRTRAAFGSPDKRVHATEEPAVLKMGKKLVARHDLNAGHVLCEDDITFKSPGDGLPPYVLDEVVGRTLLAPMRADDAIASDLLT